MSGDGGDTESGFVFLFLQFYSFGGASGAIPHQNINPLENIDLSYKHNQSKI